MCLDYTSLLPLLLFAFKFLWERLRGLFVAAPAGACAGGACALPGAGGGAPAAAVEGKEVEVAYVRSIEEWRELLQSAQADGVAVVVDFTATWCGPCQKIAPFFAKLASQHPAHKFVKARAARALRAEDEKLRCVPLHPTPAPFPPEQVDVDEVSELQDEAAVRAMPTFQLYKASKKVAEVTGALEGPLNSMVVNNCA